MVARSYKKAILIFLAASMLLAVVAAGVGVSRNRHIVRCISIRYAESTEISPGVFVLPGVDQPLKNRLYRSLNASRTRLHRFFGSVRARPVIILCPNEHEFERYAGVRSTMALSQITPLGTYIILGPDGASVDLISHEMTHAEMVHEIGYLTFQRGVFPWWFFEGMATYNDLRPELDESAYQAYEAAHQVPPLDQIDTPAEFHRDRGEWEWAAYVTSRHEFSRWYRKGGAGRLHRLLSGVRSRPDFDRLYEPPGASTTGSSL